VTVRDEPPSSAGRVTQAAPLLVAEGLKKTFQGNRAVNGVSFEVMGGELLALIGPNGAGKTTLLNLLSGQHRPSSGRILFAGVDVTQVACFAVARREMLRGYQDGGMFLKLTALENAMVPMLARGVPTGEARRHSREALCDLGLEPVLDERAERLSGGQRKLTDFARCLAMTVSLVLLDEPTTGVHPHVAQAMADRIRRRRQEGTAFVIVSHDLPWAFSVCPRVIVMTAGEVLCEGPPNVVGADPRVREAYL